MTRVNRFFRLPFSFDIIRLRQDLETCRRTQWRLHYNQQDYVGNWTSISLRSASGKTEDAYALPSTRGFIDTPLLAQCPYFQEVIACFECPKETVRLLSLSPGSYIAPHTDPALGYAFGCFRVHIPIQTGKDVQFQVDGTDLVMQPGECWYANFDLPHSVRNSGSFDRIHLVMDCVRNEWSDALFAQVGYDFEADERLKQPDAGTQRQVIEELRRMGTPTACQLADQLEAQLLGTA